MGSLVLNDTEIATEDVAKELKKAQEHLNKCLKAIANSVTIFKLASCE